VSRACGDDTRNQGRPCVRVRLRVFILYRHEFLRASTCRRSSRVYLHSAPNKSARKARVSLRGTQVQLAELSMLTACVYKLDFSDYLCYNLSACTCVPERSGSPPPHNLVPRCLTIGELHGCFERASTTQELEVGVENSGSQESLTEAPVEGYPASPPWNHLVAA
jgi:hypothetical protein